MSRNMLGDSNTIYSVGNNVSYTSDDDGVIANVAYQHVAEMVRAHSCVVETFVSVAANKDVPAVLVESGSAKKISAMASAGALDGTEGVALIQAGANVLGTAQDIADLSLTLLIRTVIETTDAILAADNGKVVRYTNGSPITITVPSGLGEGFSCVLLQRGAGAFTVDPAMGVTIDNRQSQLSSAGQHALCSVIADAADAFIFAGDTA